MKMLIGTNILIGTRKINYIMLRSIRVMWFNSIVTEEWIKEPDQPFLIFFWAGPDKVTAATTIPRSMGKKKGVYFLKSKNVVDSLKIDDLKTEVVCSELTEQGLSNLALLAQEVYYPLLSNPANRSGWSGPTSKELMLKFSNFLSKLTMTVGQSKVHTYTHALIIGCCNHC